MKLSNEEILKAVKKASREEEIEKYGHPISYVRIVRNKKKYNRKNKHKKNYEYD